VAKMLKWLKEYGIASRGVRIDRSRYHNTPEEMLPLLLPLLHIGELRKAENTELVYTHPFCAQDEKPAFNNVWLQQKTAKEIFLAYFGRLMNYVLGPWTFFAIDDIETNRIAFNKGLETFA